jgi:anti-sigma B factor antagonist
MHISAHDPSIAIITLAQADECAQLGATVDQQLAQGHRRVVIDLGQIAFLSSINIAALITCRNRIHAAHGALVLAGLNEHIGQVFHVLRLDRLFRLDLDRQAALAAVAALAP